MKSASSNTLFSGLSDKELHAITERIVHLRQDILCQSQEQFADMLSISQSYLSLVESNKKPLNENFVRKICTVLQVDVSWLLFGQGDENSIIQSVKEKISNTSSRQTLKDLQNAYSLKSSEIDFISWFLSLDSSERASLIRSIRDLQRIPPV